MLSRDIQALDVETKEPTENVVKRLEERVTVQGNGVLVSDKRRTIILPDGAWLGVRPGQVLWQWELGSFR